MHSANSSFVCGISVNTPAAKAPARAFPLMIAAAMPTASAAVASAITNGKRTNP